MCLTTLQSPRMIRELEVTRLGDNCYRPAATHWSSLPVDPSLTWDHSGNIASNAMTVSHHHQDGNLIPLLP